MPESNETNGVKMTYVIRTVWYVIGFISGVWIIWITNSVISLQNQGIRDESDRVILMELRADVKLLMELRPDVKALTTRFPSLDQEVGTRLNEIWGILHSPNRPPENKEQ